MTCKRNFTKEQLIEGLKAGQVFCVDNREAPELEDLFALERAGFVEQKLIEIDEQSSVIKWRWKELTIFDLYDEECIPGN